jgi:hypothetical protein
VEKAALGRQATQEDGVGRRKQVLEADLTGRQRLAEKVGPGGTRCRPAAEAGRQHMKKVAGSSKQLIEKASNNDGQ